MTNIKYAFWNVRIDRHAETQMCRLKQADRQTGLPIFRYAVWNRQTCRISDVPFETESRTSDVPFQTDGQTDRHSELLMCRMKQTDRQTNMPKMRCVFSNTGTEGQKCRTSDFPFETDGQSERHSEHQKSRLKQMATHTTLPTFRCAFEVVGQTDRSMQYIRFVVWDRSSDRQTDMPYLRCAVWNTRTDRHAEPQMCPFKTDGWTDWRKWRTSNVTFGTDRHSQTCRPSYMPFETDGQTERQTDMTKLRCAVWYIRT